MRADDRDSSAYDAGIRPGDVIVVVQRQRPIEDIGQLLRLVADAPIGSTVTIGAYREGRKIEFRRRPWRDAMQTAESSQKGQTM